MTRRVASPKGAKAKADKYFSLLVRSVGHCEICGSTNALQTGHIISRRFANTRCDRRNALCLCAKCHHHYTDHPYEWGEAVDRVRGEGWYADVYQLAHSKAKVDWNAVADRLKDEWEQVSA
jgi:5-methylcytosine-specific restriction endonuclease McrA